MSDFGNIFSFHMILCHLRFIFYVEVKCDQRIILASEEHSSPFGHEDISNDEILTRQPGHGTV